MASTMLNYFIHRLIMTGGIDVPNNVSYNHVYMSNGTMWWSGPQMDEVLLF